MVAVPVSTSRPLHLMCQCIWSLPLVALVESQRQSPIPAVCAETTAAVLTTGIWYFVCRTNLMLKKTSQSMSYSCCGWPCSVPAGSSRHQRPACKLNSFERTAQVGATGTLYCVFVAPNVPGWAVCAAAAAVLKRWESRSLSWLPRAV